MPINDDAVREAASRLIAAAQRLGYVREATLGGDAGYEYHLFADTADAAQFLNRLARYKRRKRPASVPAVSVIVTTRQGSRAFALRLGQLVEAEVDLSVAGTIDVHWEAALPLYRNVSEHSELYFQLTAVLIRLAALAAEATS